MPWLENMRTAAAKTMAPGRALTHQESGAPKYSPGMSPQGGGSISPPPDLPDRPGTGQGRGLTSETQSPFIMNNPWASTRLRSANVQ